MFYYTDYTGLPPTMRPHLDLAIR